MSEMLVLGLWAVMGFGVLCLVLSGVVWLVLSRHLRDS